ncbi:MAG TPA: hypothetical protein VMR39_15160, partial [Sphingobium sp.]|nr:hypothetical protein [Sphingobium sp.]
MTSSFKTLALALMLGTAASALAQPANLPPPGGEKPTAFDVHEGTSMAVSVSPDGKWLAVDLQGSLWIIPAKGGKAKRMTDYFNDARQPVWSPDGSRLVYFAYRDGNYDLWTIRPDGSDMKKLTDGVYDDRDPAFSPDGKSIAFSSDRSGNYDIWTLDIATGAMKQVSSNDQADIAERGRCARLIRRSEAPNRATTRSSRSPPAPGPAPPSPHRTVGSVAMRGAAAPAPRAGAPAEAGPGPGCT